MGHTKVYRVIGLMSGTSLDGVDAAVLETDGHTHIEPQGFLTLPYPPEARTIIRAALGVPSRADPRVIAASQIVTATHIKAIKLLEEKVDLIGFHGQTILHDPAGRITIQIGDAKALAAATRTDVVYDFRSADVAAGGQGAPFLPLYHQARIQSAGIARPVAILNLGGVGNVTWVGPGDEILAFDTGPGNALMDDFITVRTGAAYDAEGQLAARGQAQAAIIESFLAHPYFTMKPPKSLDRDAWNIAAVEYLSDADGLATLSAMTIAAVRQATRFFPAAAKAWYVTGGGRRNAYLMHTLGEALGVPVLPVEELGWNGDALEAEGFAWLAVRSLLGLPLSVPGTTGVPRPLTGGQREKAA